MLKSNFGLGASSPDSNSQSLGCKGKDAVLDLQALTAQERKFRVKSFILSCDLRNPEEGRSSWSLSFVGKPDFSSENGYFDKIRLYHVTDHRSILVT